ncbi:MAG TPA: peptidoglycan DD-metalloendopeptidase family protein [Candidatus Absconditabacterales bacterium]|nr:peptidoglycan DD-metalloendopeptidase family protein [Candidatus Absconditabacterales bacterium]
MTKIIEKLNAKMIYKAIIFVIFSTLGMRSITHGQYYQSKENLDSFDVSEATKTIKELEASIADITKQLYELDGKELGFSENLTDKYREIRAEIVSVIQDINYTTDYVGSMLQKISGYKKNILIKTQELKDTRAGIESSKEIISQFANFLYKMNHQIFDGDQVDEFKLFAMNNNIPLTLSNEHLVKSILVQFNKLMEDLGENEEEQIQLIRTLNELKLKASKDAAEYQVILNTLHQKKNYLIEFMKLYKNDQLTQQKFNMVFDSRKDVHNAMITLISNHVKKQYNGLTFNMDEKLKELEKLYNKSYKENENLQAMARPIYPIQEIGTYFGDKDFEKEFGVPNRGIQIKSEQLTPIYSSNDGIVYHITDNPGIGINWMLIIHPRGYVSAYMFMNTSLVKKGDIVRRGQLIGYSGGEPGTKGAGFISKEPNLTFFIFKDGVALDPLQFLDLSVIENKEIIPSEYSIKYLNDKYARKIDMSEVSFMTGKTLADRADQFLKHYGVGIYRELAFWEDAVKGTNIDRDMAICVAFAESTLGRYLTTANNIGNVGNNDRGDRVSMGSALEGARAIALTLNNQHLGHYHTVKQLSRYGNNEGMIYASSPINRQTNVTKCLSQIKGFYVPDEYPFRTGPNPNTFKNEENVVEEQMN